LAGAAVIVAGALIAAIYILGTTVVLVALHRLTVIFEFDIQFQ
jgi:hypothetical protein